MSTNRLTSRSALKKELIATRNILKNKIKDIKQRRQESEDLLHGGFKYIVEPIKHILDVKKEIKDEIKQEADNQLKEISKQEPFFSPNKTVKHSKFLNLEKRSVRSPLLTSSPNTTLQENTFIDDDEVFTNEQDISAIKLDDTEQPSRFEEDHETTIAELQDYYGTREGRSSIDGIFQEMEVGNLAKKYFKLLLTGGAEMDYVYGIRWDAETNKWKIGTEDFDVHKDIITLKNTSIKGTDGLFQLLFFRNPSKYNFDDLQQYKRILNLSNAHKKQYGAGNQVNRNKGDKYMKIIKQLFPPRTTAPRHLSYPEPRNLRSKQGRGLYKQVNPTKPDYIYWDSINELVDRLRLLYASKVAGNNSVNNEIVSIIEELKEAKVIQ